MFFPSFSNCWKSQDSVLDPIIWLYPCLEISSIPLAINTILMLLMPKFFISPRLSHISTCLLITIWMPHSHVGSNMHKIKFFLRLFSLEAELQGFSSDLLYWYWFSDSQVIYLVSALRRRGGTQNRAGEKMPSEISFRVVPWGSSRVLIVH